MWDVTLVQVLLREKRERDGGGGVLADVNCPALFLFFFFLFFPSFCCIYYACFLVTCQPNQKKKKKQLKMLCVRIEVWTEYST